MEYTLSIYHILLSADTRQRDEYPITINRLYAYLDYACQMLGSRRISISATRGVVQMIVVLPPNMSVCDFVYYIKSWTSAWISGNKSQNYWHNDTYVGSVSPEDKQGAIDAVNDQSTHRGIEDLIGRYKLCQCSNGQRVELPYHIIFTTSRARLLLPLKFRTQLVDAMRDACIGLEIKLLEGATMRNHVHLLCCLPICTSLVKHVKAIKMALSKWMLTNVHFRKVAEWSEDFWAYTVSPERLTEVKRHLLRQDEIHGYNETVNEMSIIYQLLDIPYVVSLH